MTLNHAGRAGVVGILGGGRVIEHHRRATEVVVIEARLIPLPCAALKVLG